MGNTTEMTASIQYILTAAQSLGSQDYYKNSLRVGSHDPFSGSNYLSGIVSVHRNVDMYNDNFFEFE